MPLLLQTGDIRLTVLSMRRWQNNLFSSNNIRDPCSDPRLLAIRYRAAKQSILLFKKN